MANVSLLVSSQPARRELSSSSNEMMASSATLFLQRSELSTLFHLLTNSDFVPYGLTTQ